MMADDDRTDGEIEDFLAKIERSLEWMRRNKSEEMAALISELQQVVDEMRAKLSRD